MLTWETLVILVYISITYLRGHSSQVHSDISEALDEVSMAALIMLDLSAAFDVINDPTLLKHLAVFVGTKEKALTWVISYLTTGTQCVSVAAKTSQDVGLRFGVPWGPVLGPKTYAYQNSWWIY